MPRSRWRHRRSSPPHTRTPLRPRLEALEDRLLLSSEPMLLKDLNLAPQSGLAFNDLARDSLTIGGVCYFAGSDSLHGSQLWRSDGTTAGIYLVKVINIDSDANPRFFTNINGTLFFQAVDTQHGSELWKSDGTEAGTVLVKDIIPGPDSSLTSQTNIFTPLGGRLFFPALASPNSFPLPWGSDGTAAGTVPLANVAWLGDTAVLGSRVYFTAGDGSSGGQLWATDCTPQGTQLVKDTTPGDRSSSVSDLRSAGNFLLFIVSSATNGYHSQLWRSDGTAAGTFLLPNFPANATPVILATGDSIAYIRASDPATGADALWKSDGTVAGTVVVTDRRFDPFNGQVVGALVYLVDASDTLSRSDGTAAGTFSLGAKSPFYRDTVGATAYFMSDDGVHGREMWETGGTVAGTRLLKDINPTGSALPEGAVFDNETTHVGGTLYFRADDGVHGYELWKSDGTDAGTVLVKDINPGSAGSDPRFLQPVNGSLLFAAFEPVHGTELWKTDGTEAGTVFVQDINTGTWGSYPHHFTAVGSTVYFETMNTIPTADDFQATEGIYRTDGTTAGTVQLAVFPLLPPPPPIDPQAPYYRPPPEILAVNGTVFFSAEDGIHGAGLWKTDGTPAGTVLVKAFGDGNYELVRNLANANGTLLFTVGYQDNFGDHAVQLWRSDGNAAGTVPLNSLTVYGTPNWPSLVQGGNLVYFAADDGVHGQRLWRSDGSDAGTFMIPASASVIASYPWLLAVNNGTVYFIGDDGVHGRELWKTDGTPAGTALVADLSPGAGSTDFTELKALNGSVFVSANVNGQRGVWKTDGTPAGTVLLEASSTDARYLTEVGNLVYFAVGNMLWRTDGTPAGTSPVIAIAPAQFPADFPLVGLTNAAGTLYFSANDGVHGDELWQSDGTTTGSTMVADLFPAGWSSNPDSLTAVGNTLYFGADDGLHGTEPWTLQVPYSPSQRLVLRLYEDLLHREADAAGLGGWTAQLDHGVPTMEVTLAIESSTEYRTRAVDGLYQALLDRHADSAGLAAGLNYLAAGGTLEQIRNSILSSAEYFNGHGQGTTEGFLRAMYQDLLGRGIDPVGLQNWQALMAAGMPRSTVVTSIAASGESLHHQVDQAYVQMLHRNADPEGEDAWADYLAAGHDNDDLLAALSSSQEYFLSAQEQPR
jgi:ELWxxDGT repeat protein